MLGSAIYQCGEDWWELVGGKEWGVRGQVLQACPDSKVKEVITSCSFPASRVRPGNPILQAAEKTRLIPGKSRVRAER